MKIAPITQHLFLLLSLLPATMVAMSLDDTADKEVKTKVDHASASAQTDVTEEPKKRKVRRVEHNPKQFEKLVTAMKNYDADAVKSLLEQKVNPNCTKDEVGPTFFSCLITQTSDSSDEHMSKILLMIDHCIRHGADVHTKFHDLARLLNGDAIYITRLSIAYIACCITPRRCEVLERLLKAGPPITSYSKEEQTINYFSYLYKYNTSEEIARILKKYNVPIPHSLEAVRILHSYSYKTIAPQI